MVMVIEIVSHRHVRGVPTTNSPLPGQTTVVVSCRLVTACTAKTELV